MHGSNALGMSVKQISKAYLVRLPLLTVPPQVAIQVAQHFIRELKQRRRRRRGRRLVKNEFIFYKPNSRLFRSARYANGSIKVFKPNMQRGRSIPNRNTKNQPSSSTFRRRLRTWSFHVVVMPRTPWKCTKNYNARAQLLFFSLNLLFGAVLVAVVVVVCLSSLFLLERRRQHDLLPFECMHVLIDGNQILRTQAGVSVSLN